MNPHALAGTSPSSWRVCLFRHSDGRATEIQRSEMVARPATPPGAHRRPDQDYWPGSDGVVLLVDSGARTAQYWAYHRRLSLRGVGVTPPIFRLHASALGSG